MLHKILLGAVGVFALVAVFLQVQLTNSQRITMELREQFVVQDITNSSNLVQSKMEGETNYAKKYYENYEINDSIGNNTIAFN